jgi:hypothetical protein
VNTDLDASLTKLSINPQASKSSSAFKQKQVVIDSWEDDELDSGEDTDRPISPQQSKDYPSAPPPTPISPSTSFSNHDSYIGAYGYGGDGTVSARMERSARPEKTDAVAKRLIAGALGVKAPKKTEEQKAYDRAIKEKEIKRRNAEKEAAAIAKEDAERAKVAVWSD